MSNIRSIWGPVYTANKKILSYNSYYLKTILKYDQVSSSNKRVEVLELYYTVLQLNII